MIVDRVYDPVEITEPVLLDLMGTQAMQRLHGVLQHGITGLLGITRRTSRFEHSVGVMLLVRRLGAPLEEQAAALLHDVSHTAFSHVIDFVFDTNQGQSYHEQMKEPFLAASDVPDLLSRHGYSWRRFLREEDFPLLEQPAPALCADRLDYFLRDSRDLGLSSEGEVRSALDHLIVAEGRIAVDDLGAARWLGETFIKSDDASWSNFREVALYELAARAIRLGLDRDILTEDDLFTGDLAAWDKLSASPDPELHAALRLVSPHTRFEWDPDSPTFWVSPKIRSIDPDVLLDGELLPLSKRDASFARLRGDYHRRKEGRWPVRVISPAA
jgi:hypothetical protein